MICWPVIMTMKRKKIQDNRNLWGVICNGNASRVVAQCGGESWSPNCICMAEMNVQICTNQAESQNACVCVWTNKYGILEQKQPLTAWPQLLILLLLQQAEQQHIIVVVACNCYFWHKVQFTFCICFVIKNKQSVVW